jgi:hypothetical protein
LTRTILTVRLSCGSLAAAVVVVVTSLRFSPPAAAVAACSCGNDVSLAELPNKKETMYSGTDVIIFKIFSQKNRKNGVFVSKHC